MLDALSNTLKVIYFFLEVTIGQPRSRPGHIIASPEPYVPPILNQFLLNVPIRFPATLSEVPKVEFDTALSDQ